MRALSRGRWDIFCSVVLRRDPLVVPLMTETEKRYQQSQFLQEQEKSLLCDFELKTKKDDRLLEKRAQLEHEGKELSELDGELGITNAMKIDEWSKKSKILQERYGLNLRGGATSNNSTIWRELDRKLYLIVKQRFDKSTQASPWILPQEKNKNSESLEETSRRCISILLGDKAKVTILGKAPFAVYTHRYPKPLRDKTTVDGAKIFFYHAHLSPTWNDIVLNDIIEAHKWVTNDEFWKTVPGKDYKKSFRTAFLE